MMDMEKKRELLQLVFEKLQANLKISVDAAFAAKAASNDEELKAENKYDTKGLEAGYLASGQAKRAQKLQEQIYTLNKIEPKSFSKETPIGITAVVKLVIDGDRSLNVFILPVGGVELHHNNQKYQTLTIESPLGQNLFKQTEGHDFELNGKDYEVVEVT